MNRARIQYGGFNITSSSNIIFSNGLLGMHGTTVLAWAPSQWVSFDLMNAFWYDRSLALKWSAPFPV
jgi:hypothetical protein